jgi:hypothetical protein
MAMTETQRVLEALRKQRLHWVNLGDGLRVQFRRPLEAEMRLLRAGVQVEHVCDFVQGWEGFTEATLLGEAVGASDPVDFMPELWAEFARDNLQVVAKVADAIAATVQAHLEAKAQAAKN